MARRVARRPHNPWIKLSREIRSYTDHCIVCFSDDRLVVHHLRYRGTRGEAERPNDLVVICWDCHTEIHRRKLVGTKNFIRFRDEMRALLPLPRRPG